MRMLASVVLVAIVLCGLGGAAAADAPPVHRTTPRAVLADLAGVLVIGIPSGRAWGIESDLRPLPAGDAAVVVRVHVDDATVREAFVRVAYYASATERTRQLAIVDSVPIRAGETRIVAIVLDPPPAAVAYRVRVLGRLGDDHTTSRADAIDALFLDASGRTGWPPLLSRLLP